CHEGVTSSVAIVKCACFKVGLRSRTPLTPAPDGRPAAGSQRAAHLWRKP
ncbi:hypothetical protein QJQ45_025282, partial [Haematococcus lacustris]